uniref:Secreted protein n=1 Tax=Globodera pallida TaxID=36090 RepID=A0A183CQN2_GLOPA
MPTFLFLAAICLLVATSILLETGSSSSGKAQSTPATSNGADVHFLLLPAHSQILMAASDVFEAMSL